MSYRQFNLLTDLYSAHLSEKNLVYSLLAERKKKIDHSYIGIVTEKGGEVTKGGEVEMSPKRIKCCH